MKDVEDTMDEVITKIKNPMKEEKIAPDNSKELDELSTQLSEFRLRVRDVEQWMDSFNKKFLTFQDAMAQKVDENKDLLLVDINALSDGMGKSNEEYNAALQRVISYKEWIDTKYPDTLTDRNALRELTSGLVLALKTVISIQQEQMKPNLARLQEKLIALNFRDWV